MYLYLSKFLPCWSCSTCFVWTCAYTVQHLIIGLFPSSENERKAKCVIKINHPPNGMSGLSFKVEKTSIQIFSLQSYIPRASIYKMVYQNSNRTIWCHSNSNIFCYCSMGNIISYILNTKTMLMQCKSRNIQTLCLESQP